MSVPKSFCHVSLFIIYWFWSNLGRDGLWHKSVSPPRSGFSSFPTSSMGVQIEITYPSWSTHAKQGCKHLDDLRMAWVVLSTCELYVDNGRSLRLASWLVGLERTGKVLIQLATSKWVSCWCSDLAPDVWEWTKDGENRRSKRIKGGGFEINK